MTNQRPPVQFSLPSLFMGSCTQDLEVAQHLQDVAATRLRSAAAFQAANGDLKQTQLSYVEAIGYYRRAAELVEAVPPARQELAEYLNAWGVASYHAGDYPAAGVPFTRALIIRERALGATHLDVATSLNNLAVLYQAQGRYAEAEPLLQRALSIREQVLGSLHPAVTESLNNLAMLYRIQGRYAEAEPLLQRALALSERLLGSKHPNVEVIRQNYFALLRATNRHAEAEQLETRARARPTRPPSIGSA